MKIDWCRLTIHSWRDMIWGYFRVNKARECRRCGRFEAYILDKYYLCPRFDDAEYADA